MNTDLLLRAADAIEAEPERFQMDQWLTPSNTNLCGTIGCIAGTVVALEYPIMEHGFYHWPLALHGMDVESAGAKLLGLDRDESHNLFVSCGWWINALYLIGWDTQEIIDLWNTHELQAITPKMAAAVLRALAEGKLTIREAVDFDTIEVRKHLMAWRNEHDKNLYVRGAGCGCDLCAVQEEAE